MYPLCKPHCPGRKHDAFSTVIFTRLCFYAVSLFSFLRGRVLFSPTERVEWRAELGSPACLVSRDSRVYRLASVGDLSSLPSRVARMLVFVRLNLTIPFSLLLLKGCR